MTLFELLLKIRLTRSALEINWLSVPLSMTTDNIKSSGSVCLNRNESKIIIEIVNYQILAKNAPKKRLL